MPFSILIILLDTLYICKSNYHIVCIKSIKYYFKLKTQNNEAMRADLYSKSTLTNMPLNVCTLQFSVIIFIFHFRAACWCGNQYPSEKFKISDSKCNAICSGDTSKNCGGLWRLSIYSTGIVG